MLFRSVSVRSNLSSDGACGTAPARAWIGGHGSRQCSLACGGGVVQAGLARSKPKCDMRALPSRGVVIVASPLVAARGGVLGWARSTRTPGAASPAWRWWPPLLPAGCGGSRHLAPVASWGGMSVGENRAATLVMAGDGGSGEASLKYLWGHC